MIYPYTLFKLLHDLQTKIPKYDSKQTTTHFWSSIYGIISMANDVNMRLLGVCSMTLR